MFRLGLKTNNNPGNIYFMKTVFSELLLTIILISCISKIGFSQDIESWAAIKSQAVAGTIDPDKYKVGPGDEFALGIWGEKSFVYQIPVSLEGEILIPEVGTISAKNFTLSELREKVIENIRQVFENVEITFTLKRVRIFRVTISGEINQPGIYLASAMDRVSELVKLAGGFLENGSKRRIQAYRNSDTLLVDLASFFALGKMEANPFLQEGDVIYVPVLKDVISCFGAFYKNADFEIIPGETFADILPFTGGFHANAILDSIELARFNSDGRIIHKQILSWFNQAPKLELQKDDRIMVRSLSKWHQKRGVNVRGEVQLPGYFAINRGETTLLQIIQIAGGFSEEASLNEAKVIRGQEVLKSDPEFERLKNMNPADMTDMEYSYFKNKSQEIQGSMAVDFERLFKLNDQSQDIILQDGDEVIIPKKRNFIRVSGAILFSGNIPFQKNLEVNDYIQLAGGYSWNARKNKLRVIKARTGEWLKKSSVKQLEPGDTIWVPEKPERDWWLLFRQVMTVAAQGATVYLVVKTAVN